jgi:uncharacterized protein
MTAIVETGAGATDQSDIDFPVIDCDVHPMFGGVQVLRPYLSPRVQRRIFGQEISPVTRDPNRIPHPTSGLRLDAVGPDQGPPGSNAEFSLQQWIIPFGISSSILIPIQAGSILPWGDEQAGAEYLAALNRYFISEWCEFDSRYRLAISVSPYNMKSAVQEIEELADVPGVCAVFVPHAAVAMGRSQLFPMYEAAERHGLPVLLHPTGGEGNLRDAPWLAGGLPDTYPERHSMLLQPGQAILASVIFGGVFDHFPKLKVLLVEYGITWAASMIARMDKAWELGDGELSGILRKPSEYVFDNVRFTTQPLDEPPKREMLWDILEMVHAERTVMFSSDYPHWDNDNPRLILSTRLPRHLRRRIGFETARETFGARAGL